MYVDNNFVRLLEAGEYAFWTSSKQLQFKTYSLERPEAKIEQLELLLQTHQEVLERYLTIVRTEFDRVALLQIKQNWIDRAHQINLGLSGKDLSP